MGKLESFLTAANNAFDGIVHVGFCVDTKSTDCSDPSFRRRRGLRAHAAFDPASNVSAELVLSREEVMLKLAGGMNTLLPNRLDGLCR